MRVQPAGVEAELKDPAGLWEALLPKARLPLDVRARGRVPGRRHVHAPRPVLVPADARRARPPPRRWRAATRSSTSGSARTSARSTASPAPRSRSGRRTRARSRSSATSTRWDGRLHPMRSLGVVRDLGALRPRRRGGREVQVRDPHAGRAAAAEGRPARVPRRGAARERVGRLPARSTSGRDDEWLERARRVDPLRAPISIYEVHLGSWRRNPLDGQPPADLPRARRRARRLRRRPRLHARRADAGDGASVLRLVGLPGDRLLRADVALRHARRLPLLRRPAARSAASA